MRVVPTVARATLAGRALRARGTPAGWLVLTATEAVVLDRALVRRGAVPLPPGPPPEDATVTPAGDAVVLATDRALVCLELDGGERWRVRGRFHACQLVGDELWAIARVDRHHVELAAHDPTTGKVDLTLPLEDPQADASFVLCEHPRPHTVLVWVAAGQDGQHALLVLNEGVGLKALPVPPDDALPPVFTPAGDTYLAADADRLALRRWPSGEVLDELAWDDGADERAACDVAAAPDDPAGSHVDVLPGGFGCWASSNGRLYLIDLGELYVVDELTIEGHPLRPVSVRFPRLRDDHTPCTDFQYAVRGPDDLILSVHADVELRVTDARAWVGAAAR
jgi:hypothetical protein